MAQNYLVCPINLSAPFLIEKTVGFCRKYEIDGVVLHSSRTCRAFTNPQYLLAEATTTQLGIPSTMFEGDVTDESFYKDELLNSRVETMLEAIDSRRISGKLPESAMAPPRVTLESPVTFHRN